MEREKELKVKQLLEQQKKIQLDRDEEWRRITEAFKAELEQERLRIEEANRLLDEERIRFEFEK